MLYELIGIVRPGNIAEVKEIVQTTGTLILSRGGVIRSLANWGVFSLPRPVSAHQMRHRRGHYFAMRFDGGPQTQEAVRATLALDPRVIRASSVRLGREGGAEGGGLEETARFGEIKWAQAFDRT